MAQPTDYISPLLQASINPAQTFGQGMAVGNQLVDNQRAAVADQRQGLMFAQTQQDRAAAIEAAKAQAIAQARKGVAYAEDLAALRGKSDPQAFLDFARAHPEATDQMVKLHEAQSKEVKERRFGQAVRTKALLANGQKATAVDQLQRDALALEETDPQEAEALRQQADAIDKDPTDAQMQVDLYMARVAPKEYADIATTLGQQPSVVAKAKAEAKVAETKALNADRDAILAQGFTQAQTDRLLAQTKNEAARLGLDWAKLRQETARDNAALAAKATELTAGEATRMGDAALEANKQRQMSRQTGSLASRFEGHAATPTLTGAAGGAVEAVRGFAGSPGEMTADRNEFRGVVEKVVGQALKGGGAITDSERASIRSTMPKPTDDPALISKWLRRVERLQDRDSKLDMAQAEFIALNGGLGNVKKPGIINGVEVKPGMTFGKYLDVVDETIGPVDGSAAPGGQPANPEATAAADALFGVK